MPLMSISGLYSLAEIAGLRRRHHRRVIELSLPLSLKQSMSRLKIVPHLPTTAGEKVSIL